MRKGGAAASIVLLDACRLNAPPFGSAATRALAGSGAARGMRVTAAALPAEDASAEGNSRGTVVAWACGDGQVAFDGDGNRSAHAQRNGLFTKHLLKHMAAGSALDVLLARVRDGVAEESLRRQLPCVSVQTLGRSLLLAPNVTRRFGGGCDADDEEHGGGALLGALLRGALAAAAALLAVKGAQLLLKAAAAHRDELDGAVGAELATTRRRARALEAQLRRAEADAEVATLEKALQAKAAAAQQAQAMATATARARRAEQVREEQACAKAAAARVQEVERLAAASAAAQAAAVRIIRGFAKNGDALEGIAATMAAHASSSAVQQAGCSALELIADNVNALVANDVFAAPVAALTAHRADEGVAGACCRAVHSA
jgi:hypothetical protein